MRFVQFSDVHLDSTVGGSMNLPEDKKSTLRRDMRTALARACGLVSEYKADLVLIPGDLFDHETVRADTATFIADLFRSMAPIPIFIAPGNHDSLRPGSPYMPVGGVEWPANVHIFTSADFESVAIDELDCGVTGMGHAHRGVTDRLLAGEVGRAGKSVNLLIFHGSRDGYKPSEKESVIPFSDQELLAQGFTYAAIGHYHSLSRITDPNGCVRGAYSGCVQGRGLDEAGEKCVIIGEITADGRVTLDKVEVAPRRVITVEVDVTGTRSDTEMLGKIDAALTASGARPCDMVNISLYGAIAPNLTLDTSQLENSARFFHVSINRSRVRPDYDLESLVGDNAAPSLKSEFVRGMLELERGATDDVERRALRDAIYYGLYALDGRKLEPLDAD
ncbi:MAG: DNA repair exonuclease [Armatimonadetes bacterium]|nr:DNA repair exonuclease [Armatimonadota bacterium]